MIANEIRRTERENKLWACSCSSALMNCAVKPLRALLIANTPCEMVNQSWNHYGRGSGLISRVPRTDWSDGR